MLLEVDKKIPAKRARHLEIDNIVENMWLLTRSVIIALCSGEKVLYMGMFYFIHRASRQPYIALLVTE